jgi:hypothetical protein
MTVDCGFMSPQARAPGRRAYAPCVSRVRRLAPRRRLEARRLRTYASNGSFIVSLGRRPGRGFRGGRQAAGHGFDSRQGACAQLFGVRSAATPSPPLRSLKALTRGRRQARRSACERLTQGRVCPQGGQSRKMQAQCRLAAPGKLRPDLQTGRVAERSRVTVTRVSLVASPPPKLSRRPGGGR